MENREQQILSEIKQLMNSVRMQLEQLDTKMAELQQIYDPQEFESEPIDFGAFPLDLDGDISLSVETEDVTEDIAEEVTVPEYEPEIVEEPEASEAPEVVVVPEVEDEDLPVEDEEEEPAGDSLFMPVEEVSTTLNQQVQSATVQTAVIDVMAKKHAWRSDRPGTPVKDIRAAIALVDRALFINRLFGEDAMKFMDTLNHINQMSNLDEAVEYLASTYPEWDFDSDIVYRFMMAVRRKIN